MDVKEVIETLIFHKRRLDAILSEYDENEGAARQKFLTAKEDLSRVFEKTFVGLRFNKLAYGNDKTAVKNAISFISNVITGVENGDDAAAIAPQN
jgi:hypothetical protein